ncbi:MAG: hypothetical protein M3340_17910 [Actinomycetota bacterium]|nr:hypothetical protein [Actinomycetota bacterium]
MARRIGHELLEGLATGLLAVTIVLGSAFVWIGVPLGGLWLAGRITTEPDRFLLFALCSIPTAMVVFGWLLYRVNRVYESLRAGTRVQVVGSRSPWLRSSSDASRRDRQAPRALIDVAMIASAWTALVLMAVWFFLFAELRLVNW